MNASTLPRSSRKLPGHDLQRLDRWSDRHGNDEAPAPSGEGVFASDEAVGVVTSGGWGHRVSKNLAMAYLHPNHTQRGTVLTVWLRGEPVAATVTTVCTFDPDNDLPRGITSPVA